MYCPACNRDVPPQLIADPTNVDVVLRPLLTVNANGWEPGKPICTECLSRFYRVFNQLVDTYPQFAEQQLKILPTPLRLDATEAYHGRGITIAFLDSGFYAHPDLTEPHNRIIAYHDITGRTKAEDLQTPRVSSWHGMMTSVVAAGNGLLSNGLYRGIASQANLVFVKVGRAARVRHKDIAAGLHWVIENRKRYKIRIVNVSCGGDFEASYLTDELSQAAEAAVRAGLVVVAAVGNAGMDEHHPVLPPASAPSVISVGGLNDNNAFDANRFDIYRSSYGPTIDGLQKPEVIAPGIWVAAPILPRTPTAEQAALLSKLENAKDDELHEIVKAHSGIDEQLDHAAKLAPYLIRQIVWLKIRDNSLISHHYKHVDGTSFAAPIVASIVAQMLEAVPHTKPHEIKYALVKTATRIPHVPVDRQGWGRVNASIAVRAVLAMHDAKRKTAKR